ncbi:MAG: flagellar hook-length control protein FliK [Dethiobacter sp.]|nr:flagellar hook-length control protein FliK [Dethiobacter sp.]
MEMNNLALLMPTLQSKVLSPRSGNGQPSAGFAGLLAILQQQQGLGPEAASVAAIVASQLMGSEEQAGALPELLAVFLPQMMSQLMSDGSATLQEAGGTDSVALSLPAVLLGLPLQLPEFAAGGADGRVCAGGSTVLSGTALHAAVAAELGVEKLLPETLPAAALQAAAVAKQEAEKLLAGQATAVSQEAAALEAGAEKLLPETLSVGTNDAPADRPAVTAKPAPEKGPLLHLQTAERAAADLPVPRLNRPEPLSTIQGPPALGYQAFSGGAALPSAVVRFAQSQLGRAAVAEQVLEKMVFRRESEGDSSLSVRLRPAALGEVQINLRLEDGRLMARIVTENLYVKEALDAALGQVKQRLEAQQIQVAELTVTVGSQQDFRQGRAFSPFWQDSEIKGKRPAMAGVAAERGGSQPVSLRQGLVDARV